MTTFYQNEPFKILVLLQLLKKKIVLLLLVIVVVFVVIVVVVGVFLFQCIIMSKEKDSFGSGMKMK